MNKELIQRAAAIMNKASVVGLSSINEEGYPRIVNMLNIKTEGIGTVWFSTGAKCKKVKDYIMNPKASVCYLVDGDGVTLMGEISVVDDPTIKKELWDDSYVKYYPLGVNDPSYCVLKFQTQICQAWLGDDYGEMNGVDELAK